MLVEVGILCTDFLKLLLLFSGIKDGLIYVYKNSKMFFLLLFEPEDELFYGVDTLLFLSF